MWLNAFQNSLVCVGLNRSARRELQTGYRAIYRIRRVLSGHNSRTFKYVSRTKFRIHTDPRANITAHAHMAIKEFFLQI